MRIPKHLRAIAVSSCLLGFLVTACSCYTPVKADSIVWLELPIDGINAEIQRAADNKKTWISDAEKIAQRFWQEQAVDPYADSKRVAEPYMKLLPKSAIHTNQVGVRLIEQDGGGDDSISREWIELWLHRDTEDRPWRVQRAIRAWECARGVSGDTCL